MKIKFNGTGTHLKNGKLLIRLDFYSDLTCKTYTQQNVDVFTRELTKEERERDENEVLTEKAKELQKLVPTKKQLNPFLCHFISIDSNMTKGELIAYIKTTFKRSTLEQLDDILSVDNRKDELYPVLVGKFVNGLANVKAIDKASINAKFADLEEVI